MPSTITALFDSRADAEAAKERLKTLPLDADHIHIHDQSSPGHSETEYSTHENRGIWDSIKHAFLPDEDRHTYEQGVRQGGVLLTADVEDAHVDAAAQILEDANGVDIEDRSSQWRSSGWSYPAAAVGLGASGVDTLHDTALDRNLATESQYETGLDRTPEVSSLHDTGLGSTLGAEHEEVVPIVQEQLVVGKRDVSRGGVRVRSYVTETPVHEQIRLRNEQVHVERRAVDLPLSAADGDAFRERTIELTATGEEAVVGKTARVVEEVVVSKTAEEHEEQIDETVRRTDVEIDHDAEDVAQRSTVADKLV